MRDTRITPFATCLLGMAFVASSFAGEIVDPLDAFEDSGFSLFAFEETVGSEGPSSAIGGFRAVSFSNNFRDGTATLDENAGTLSLLSNGAGQVTIGYGYRVVPGGLQGGGLTPVLDADLSAYEVIRFNVLENEAKTRPMRFNVTLLTSLGNAFASSSIMAETPDGFEGVFDIPFDSITGGAVRSDIDLILINIPNAMQEMAWTIGPIELVDLDGASICAGDCDESGSVDFGDLVAMLGQFGNDTGDGCDADESGSVDFGDLVTTLGLFGPCS